MAKPKKIPKKPVSAPETEDFQEQEFVVEQAPEEDTSEEEEW